MLDGGVTQVRPGLRSALLVRPVGHGRVLVHPRPRVAVIVHRLGTGRAGHAAGASAR